MKTVKLTSKQRELLADIGCGGRCAPTYPPAKKLVEYGFIVFERKPGHLSERPRITHEGQAYLTDPAHQGE